MSINSIDSSHKSSFPTGILIYSLFILLLLYVASTSIYELFTTPKVTAISSEVVQIEGIVFSETEHGIKKGVPNASVSFFFGRSIHSHQAEIISETFTDEEGTFSVAMNPSEDESAPVYIEVRSKNNTAQTWNYVVKDILSREENKKLELNIQLNPFRDHPKLIQSLKTIDTEFKTKRNFLQEELEKNHQNLSTTEKLSKEQMRGILRKIIYSQQILAIDSSDFSRNKLSVDKLHRSIVSTTKFQDSLFIEAMYLLRTLK